MRSFLASYGLLLGKKAFGTRKYIRQPFFDALENRLTMGVMRGNFVHGQPRGFYCCRVCSLALMPLYEMDMLTQLPGRELAASLRGMIERREGRFNSLPPKKLLDFSLSF